MVSAGPIAVVPRRSAAPSGSGAAPAGWSVNFWPSARPSSSSGSCSRLGPMCCRPTWSRSSRACRIGCPASRSASWRSCSARSWASAAPRSSTWRWSRSGPPASPRCIAPACAAVVRWCSRCSGRAWSSASVSIWRCCSRWPPRCSATPAGAWAATGSASPRSAAACCCASSISAWRPSTPRASASSSSMTRASGFRLWSGSSPRAGCSASTTCPASRSPTAPP